MVGGWECLRINRVGYKGEVSLLLSNCVNLRFFNFHFFEFVSNLGFHLFDKLIVQEMGSRAWKGVILVGILLKYLVNVGIFFYFFDLKISKFLVLHLRRLASFA